MCYSSYGYQGNIGRTCLGLGARLHLIEPLGFSLSSKHVRRAGLDYWDSVDLRLYPSFTQFLTQTSSYFTQMLFFTKYADESIFDIRYALKGKIALIFGSEVDGFSSIEEELKEVRRRCERGKNGERKERFVAFPMVNHEVFRSFNLSTTASMALWDAVKQLSVQ